MKSAGIVLSGVFVLADAATLQAHGSPVTRVVKIIEDLKEKN